MLARVQQLNLHPYAIDGKCSSEIVNAKNCNRNGDILNDKRDDDDDEFNSTSEEMVQLILNHGANPIHIDGREGGLKMVPLPYIGLVVALMQVDLVVV
eukprot:5517271-Ditylum_brightwellii.AAC.1